MTWNNSIKNTTTPNRYNWISVNPKLLKHWKVCFIGQNYYLHDKLCYCFVGPSLILSLLQASLSSLWQKFGSKGDFGYETQILWTCLSLQNSKPFSTPHHYRPRILKSLYIYLLTAVPWNILSGLLTLERSFRAGESQSNSGQPSISKYL